MHPILLYWKVPVSWAGTFGPGSLIFRNWQVLAGGAILAFVAWMWATSPDRKEPRTVWAWLAGALVLLFGLPLLGVGLVRMGEFKLHTYGVMLSLGFVVGITLAVIEARRVGEHPEKVLDLTFWILISSIVGSRILYILTTLDEYVAEPAKLFRVWEGGLVFYGGLLGAIAMSVWFTKRHQMSFWKIADTLIPSVVLGQTFGRIGCFSAGCCFGKPAPADMSWAVKFPEGAAAQLGMIHPTQMYEAFANLFIFFLLLWVRTRKTFHGAVLVAYMLGYSLLRFVIETVRGDKIRGFVFEWDLVKIIPGPEILSTSQTVSLLLFFAGIGFWIWKAHEAKKI